MALSELRERKPGIADGTIGVPKTIGRDVIVARER